MLTAIFEGTPVGTIPVEPFNSASPVYWEAGAIGMINANGNGIVSSGAAAYGILADRRSSVPGIAIASFLPANVGNYGDESLFNQPGHGNNLYGSNTETVGTSNNISETINAVIPLNAIPTTTLLKDETSANPNTNGRYITMYTRGGSYATDQYDTAQTYVPGTTLWVMTDGSGRLTNQTATVIVGSVEAAVDGNGFLRFKSVL